ncbi:UNVERIFIED_CONTAM: hypothetical protein PYX00_007492 [Menopon gallinae]|uniref:Uncharacterized protein n=1 Tax=Menopon gallinae TaxID=328185 RepID=A0AAW2HK84_9NEOP
MDKIRQSWATSSDSAAQSISEKIRTCWRRIWTGSGPEKDAYEPTIKIRTNPSGRILKPDRSIMVGPHEPEYFTDHERRGRVYIFNHASFKKYSKRDGSNEDVLNLKDALPKLGFRAEDITSFDNFTLDQIEEKLEEISQDDHSNCDMMVVFVLTHGEQDGKLHAYDREYTVNEIWEHFTADRCKSLVGKPKIFFIIACRGNKMDKGETIQVQTRKMSVTEIDAVRCQKTVSYTIPVWADFLTIYSTMEGYYSYRNPAEGTWYIQALCQEIKNFKQPNMHFLDFLTRVTRKVATSYQTMFDDPRLNNKKQCPFITSSLTKVINLKLMKTATDSVSEKERPKSYN